MAKKKIKKTGKKTAAIPKPAKSRKKTVTKKAVTKSPASKTAPKKAAPKKNVAKKSVAKKPAAKKNVTKKLIAPTDRTPRRPLKLVSEPSNKHPKKALKSKLPAPKLVSGGNFEPKAAFDDLESPEQPGTPLVGKELDYYRELLLAKRAEISNDVSTLQNQAMNENRQDASGDLSNMPIHMADLGTDNYEKEFTLGLLESERNLLCEIQEALKRIEEGTYGVCQATGRQIGKARLKAQPWVRYCYEYVLSQERGQSPTRW